MGIGRSADSSRTTHAAEEAVDACRYFGGLLVGALRGVGKETLLSACYSTRRSRCSAATVRNLIPRGGLVVLAGKPGVGKTTLTVDLVFHLASGRDWLGLPVGRSLNVLVVENEGPIQQFQAKLAHKREKWGHSIKDEIHVHTWQRRSLDLEQGARYRPHRLTITPGPPPRKSTATGTSSPWPARSDRVP